MLQIKDLTVKVNNKVILDNFNLEIEQGSIHALMGQNGAGKSTIAKVLLRDPNYEVVNGSITYNDTDLLKLDTTSVARMGFFMVSQNPMEIEGISNAELLRTAYHECGKNEINILEFNKKLTNLCNKLSIPTSFIHRDINFNMSGGEKKKNELLHLWMLEPNFIILDEIDSGLDVDALKMVATSIKEYYEEYKPSILVITHQKSLLDIIKPEHVHILSDKHIKVSGDNLLLDKVFNEGFGSF